MNKKTAIRRLEVIEQEAQELRKMIDEPEKSKLGHGDFGITNYKPPRVNFPMLAFKPSMREKVIRITHFDGSGGFEQDDNHIEWLGNIFDLMKDWGEDLTYFKFDVHEYKINTKEFAHAPIYIAGNSHTLVEAEEIWRKLGQMIATYKRTKT